jgi:enolase
MARSGEIRRVWAREVFDSRGNPTVEVEIHCDGGAKGRAIVPSGASTGKHEARELRDNDPSRFGGKGVRKAVDNVCRAIGPRLLGSPVTDQVRIDQLLRELDGTSDKSKLGANAILGTSLACAHAAAVAEDLPLWAYLARCVPEEVKPRLPTPMVNMISGGLHAGGNLDFQDFLFVPVGTGSFFQALEMSVAVYRALGRVLTEKGYDGTLVGDEGGYGPRLPSNEDALQVLLVAIEKAGLTPGKDAVLAVDVGSSQFYRDGSYHLHAHTSRKLSSQELADLFCRWVDRYPIVAIEDGMAEDDWEGWKKLTELVSHRVQLIGDDLFVTNPARLRHGIASKIANCILVKPNQIGTLTETLDLIALAHSGGYGTVISARSGETEDTTIADLAVATGAGQIKIGSVARSERLAKYNQLLRIEEDLGRRERLAGSND